MLGHPTRRNRINNTMNFICISIEILRGQASFPLKIPHTNCLILPHRQAAVDLDDLSGHILRALA